MLNLLGAERVVAGLALALVGCASIAGVGGGDPGDDSSEEAPHASTDTKAGSTAGGGQSGTNSSGGQAQTQTQTQTTPAPTTTTTKPPTQPTSKKDLGEKCDTSKDCKSGNCSDEIEICIKKPNQGAFCLQPNTVFCVNDDACCGGDYCAGKCQACKAAGESPDAIFGRSSCCTGVTGSTGKCR